MSKVMKVPADKGTKVTKSTKEKLVAPKINRAMADVPAIERRHALIKLLKQSKAVNSASARPISYLATKLGYVPYDVYLLAYHKFSLVKNGLVATCKLEEYRDLCVYLTPKGVKTPVTEIK